MPISEIYSYRALEPEIVLKKAKDTSTLIVSIVEAVNWNNQTPGIATFQAGLYTQLINAAREIVEKYCWIDLTQATYQAYFDLSRYGIFNMFLSNLRLLLNRSPIFSLSNILLIEYLNDAGTWITFDPGTPDSVPGLFANVTEKQEQLGWASLYFINPPAWVSTINAYKARITFTAGYDLSYSGSVTLSYNSITGIVTAITPTPNLLNNNGMTAIISGATHTGYNGTFPITVINNTTFTYQLAPSLSLPSDSGQYVSTPNSLYAIPETLLLAIKNIISYNYATRGDVPSMENLNGYPVPAGTKALLDQYSVARTQLGVHLC